MEPNSKEPKQMTVLGNPQRSTVHHVATIFHTVYKLTVINQISKYRFKGKTKGEYLTCDSNHQTSTAVY